jgi:hypothetical protein
MAGATALHYSLAAAAAALAACWALYRFVASIRRDRMVGDTPLVHIRSAAQGYVKVFGRAKPAGEQPTAAPLSLRPCVWWSFEVSERRRNSKGGTEWQSVASATSVEPFVLADADAECLVGPVNAEITPTTHDVWYGDEPRPSGPPAREGGFGSGSNYRYSERLLGVGDQLSVVGELRSHTEIDGAEAATVALLRRWKQDQAGLLARFDSNHDGHIDEREWELARQAAAAEVQATMLKTPVSRISVIGEPVHGEPFLIAAMDADHLVRREKLRAAVFFAVGLLCVVVSAWAIDHARALAAPLTSSAGG